VLPSSVLAKRKKKAVMTMVADKLIVFVLLRRTAAYV
jgi:hypothetical protein